MVSLGVPGTLLVVMTAVVKKFGDPAKPDYPEETAETGKLLSVMSDERPRLAFAELQPECLDGPGGPRAHFTST